MLTSINKIYNQDCLLGMSNLPDSSIDLIVTDPPYEIKDISLYLAEFYRLLKPSGSLYVFGNKNMVAENWFSQCKFAHKELLIWHYVNSPKPKGRWRMSFQAIIYAYKSLNSTFNEDAARVEYKPATKNLNGRMRPSLGRLNKETKPYNTSKGALPRDVILAPALCGHLAKERVGHKDQKPLSLIKKLIETSSNPDDLVLDAFAGSGTIGKACIETKRNYILFEKEYNNYIMALGRLS